MSFIRLEGVTKRLGGRRVLDGLDLAIEKGETFVLLGSSGSGKSVTLKHMIRLLTPDEGRVWIGEDDIAVAGKRDLERIRRRFGVLFQGAALLQWMSVADNVALPLRERTALSEAEIAKRVAAKLELLGLSEARDRLPADLSGGMQKRVGLARAMILNPEIILYDEPTSGLDPVTSRHIDRTIDDLRRQFAVTSVVVTHDLHSALHIGQRIGVIDRGRIVEIAEPRAFVRSANETVRRFLEAQYITARGSWEEPSP
jgi:phospholipid/cholesterol/gamma-HCH transport system ATP-binding protein